MTNQKNLLILLTLLTGIALHAQKFRYHLYQGDQIPFKKVNQVIQDHKQFMWMATDNGLYRYDGATFEDHNISLKSRYIKGLQRWAGDTLLFAHDNGVHKLYYEGEKVRITSMITRESSPELSYPEGIFVDSKKRVWITSRDANLFQIDGGSNRLVAMNPSSEGKGLPRLQEDSHGTIWLLQPGDGLYAYNETDGSFKRHSAQKESSDFLVDNDNIWLVGKGMKLYRSERDWQGTVLIDEWSDGQQYSYITTDLSGLLFVYSQEGLFTLNPNSEDPSPTKVFGSNDPHRIRELPIDHVNSIYFTANEIRAGGTIWLSTDTGVAILWSSYFQSVSGMSHDNVFGMSEGPDDEVLIAQSEVNRVRMSNEQESWDIISGLTKVTGITSTVGDSWFSTTDGQVYQYRNGSRIRSYDMSDRGGGIFFIASDTSGNVWFCQAPTDAPILGVAKIDPNGKYVEYGRDKGFASRVLVVDEGGKNEVYAAGIGLNSYLYKYDQSKDTFENISPNLSFEVGDNFEIHDMSVDDSGIVWLASTDGLLKYDTERIQRVDLGTLTANEIRSVHAMSNSSLWLATDTNGLIHLDSNGHYVVFDEQSGTPSKVTSYRSMLCDKSNRLWVGTAEGAIYSFQENPEPLTSKKPYFKYVSVDGEPLKENTSLSFGRKDQVDFHYAPMDYPSNEIRFQHRIIDNSMPDEEREAVEWSEINSNPVASASDLEAGEYVLQFRERQGGGFDWSDPHEINFTINTAWYKTAWGIVILLLGATGLFWYLFQLRLKKKTASLRSSLDEKVRELSDKEVEMALKSKNMSKRLKEMKQTGISIYLLNRLLRQLPRENSWREILDNLSKLVRFSSGLDALELGLLDKNSIHFKGYSKDELSGYERESEFNEKTNMASFILAHNKPIYLKDYAAEMGVYINAEIQTKYASAIYIPIELRDNSEMVLCAYRKSAKAFTEEDRTMIRILSEFLSKYSSKNWSA